MGFPKKFKHLLESTVDDVDRPDYLWLSFAVCATTAEACGWGGWMIEGAYKNTGKHDPTASGDQLLSFDNESQRCPRCSHPLFRTEVSLRFTPSQDQTNLTGVAGVDYEVAPMEYDE